MQFKEAQQLHIAMGPLSQGNSPRLNKPKSRQVALEIKTPTIHHVDLNQSTIIP